jgi:hypothetical protein
VLVVVVVVVAAAAAYFVIDSVRKILDALLYCCFLLFVEYNIYLHFTLSEEAHIVLIPITCRI